MLRWPQTTEHDGVVTISARHWTAGSNALVDKIVPFVLMGLMVLGGGIVYFRTGDLCSAIGAGIFSIYPGVFLAIVLIPVIWLAVLRKTVVVISPDYIRAGGSKYNRGSAAIQFTNLYPQKMSVEKGEGRHTMSGMLEETTGLRMFYGANALLITRFRSAERASRFALACNAALESVMPAGSYGSLPRVSAGELYDGGGGNAALPGQTRPAIASRGGDGLLPGQTRRALPAGTPPGGDMRAILIASRTTYTHEQPRPSGGAVFFALLVFAGLATAGYFYAAVGHFCTGVYHAIMGQVTPNGTGTKSMTFGYTVAAVVFGMAAVVVCFATYHALSTGRRFVATTSKLALTALVFLLLGGSIGTWYYVSNRKAHTAKERWRDYLNNLPHSHAYEPAYQPSIPDAGSADDRPKPTEKDFSNMVPATPPK